MEIPLLYFIFLFLAAVLLFIISLLNISIIALPDDYIEEKIKEGDFRYFIIKRSIQNPLRFQNANNISTFIIKVFLLFTIYFIINRILPIFIIKTTAIAIKIILLLCSIALIEILLVNLPKQIGSKFGKAVAEKLAIITYLHYYISLPLVIIIETISNYLENIFKLKGLDSTTITEEEIRLMMDIGAKKGTIQTEEKTLIENIFNFNNITAEDIMTHRTDVFAINIHDSNETILNIIKNSGYSRFPVYNDEIDNIMGIISSRSFLMNLHQSKPKALQEIIYPPFIAPVQIRADVLFRKMQQAKNHLAILVDEYGGFNGIVTMEDLLEEIVGQIYDENDVFEEKDIVQIHKNLWRMSGAAEIENINQQLHLDIPENDNFDTLNGMVFHHLSTIPTDGSKLEIDLYGMHIQVQKIKDHRIFVALVSKQINNE